MRKLNSAVDTGSAAFAANAEINRGLVAELRDRAGTAALGGPAQSRERHTSRGKLLPRDRVMRLLDPGAPFLEVGGLVANGLYDDEAPAAGVITGIGRVSGREVMIIANDATVKGGAYFPLTVKKHLRAQEIAWNRTACRASIWSTPAAPTCRTRPRCSPTASISAASSTTRPTG